MSNRPAGAGTQGRLFAEAPDREVSAQGPLAERMRPRTLDEFVGQGHLVGHGRLLRQMIEGGRLQSLILWGPPGSGKTTLARLIASGAGAHCVRYSAVLSGLREVKAGIEEAKARLHRSGRRTVVFIDEIHRFNKAQQDAFLPFVEEGTIVLIGATTENPSFEVIAPLLSRTAVLVLKALTEAELRRIVDGALRDRSRGLGTLELNCDPEAAAAMAMGAQGDARRALNVLEAAAGLAVADGARTIQMAHVREAMQHRGPRYDKKGDQHYDVVSAFIKSLRDSDPDGAVYWMMRMIDAGEDPLFVARRMIIFAAEDVGNADPAALQVAVAAKDALHFVGMPEGRIPLAQACTYLAAAPKSNRSYRAMLDAQADVERYGALEVPMHLRNAVTALTKKLGYAEGYRYVHDTGVPNEQHLPDELHGKRYYEPVREGFEATIAERLAQRRRGST